MILLLILFSNIHNGNNEALKIVDMKRRREKFVSCLILKMKQMDPKLRALDSIGQPEMLSKNNRTVANKSHLVGHRTNEPLMGHKKGLKNRSRIYCIFTTFLY